VTPSPFQPLAASQFRQSNAASVVGSRRLARLTHVSSSGGAAKIGREFAPAGGALVTLTASNGVATVPQMIVVGVGQSSATFTVATKVVNINRSVVISAAYNGSVKSATLAVKKRRN